MLTFLSHPSITVQAGTPMTVTGEESLPPWLEAGRPALFICFQISSGGGDAERVAAGGRQPPVAGSAGNNAGVLRHA